MKLSEYRPKARVGDVIRTNGDSRTTGSWFGGTVEVADKEKLLVRREDTGRSWIIRWNNQDDCRVTRLSKGIKKMGLLSKIKRIAMPEPTRSFLKAGIVDECGDFTDEGREVFLGYLLEKFGKDFKSDIVESLLAQIKEDKKN